MQAQALEWLRQRQAENRSAAEIQQLAENEKARNVLWGEALLFTIEAWLRTTASRLQRTINGTAGADPTWFQPAFRVFGSTPCYQIYSSRLTAGDTEWESSLDRETDAVLFEVQNPRQRGLKKGVVFGYVQSGKTANFNGVIAKAIDNYYRLIIVFGGVKNPLLQQTIERLKSDLVEPVREHDSADVNSSLFFEENLPAVRQMGAVNGLLDRFRNFLGNPGDRQLKSLILCTLKNSCRIPRVTHLLKQFPNLPVLVIDDECDEAAVPRAERNQTSQRMANLIEHMRERNTAATYLGYTATPAANFLVRKQLRQSAVFPDDFIHVLDEPPEDNEYLGITNLFEEGAE